MTMATFQALGHTYDVTLRNLRTLREAGPAREARVPETASLDAGATAHLLDASSVLRSRIDDPLELAVVTAPSPIRPRRASSRAESVALPAKATTTLATQTVIAEGLRQADLQAARDFGATVIDEGFDGKVLLKVDSVARAFDLVARLQARQVGSASPNFLRRVVRLKPSAPVTAWAPAKIGVPEAWDVTRGDASVSIAVLDEGVDTRHPALRPAVVAERDFIGDKGDSAVPDGDDAHGTACAGIVVSRDRTSPGIAPRCSLIAVRIAMGDGTPDGWVFDDYATADAIDWSWRQGAAILSNSWGGGAPSDAISRAFARARTQGRQGRGAVVVLAAGNEQAPTDFPASLPGYVTVGASNHKDQRKTLTSADGEPWGSNYGPTMRLIAPGVFIWTTDILGTAGYDPGDFTRSFNGTSAATPHVAGAAALMLSVSPHLGASTIRNMLGKSARKIAGQKGWTQELGYGRLDVAKAVALARAAQPSPTGKVPRRAKKR